MLNQYLQMGGYGIYVWPAYAVTLIIFAANLWFSWRENKKMKKFIRQHEH